MKFLLMNSAMMPAPGTYKMKQITPDAFGREVARAHRSGRLQSHIGYEQTAALIERLAGAPIAVSREPAVISGADIMLICRLRYRVANPATKGAPVSDDGFEFFICYFQEAS